MSKILPSLLLLIAPLCAGAQVTGQNRQPNDESGFTLAVDTQLVTESVTIRDKNGNTITGLTAKDFSLTEDGVPQTVRFVEYQTLPLPTTPLPEIKERSTVLYKQLGREQITPEDTNKQRYNNRRLMALYFDMSSMGPAEMLRAINAAEKFLSTQITEVDQVSILRFSNGSVDVLSDFTNDRTRLLSILNTMAVGENSEWATAGNSTDAADKGAAFGQDDTEFNIFNTDRQLSALQTAANMLGRLKEKKALVYFASGLRLNGVDNQAQLHATIDAAIRADVTFWPIDARGLVASAPMGDASVGSPGGLSMYTGATELSMQSNFLQSQDTLYALAADTGGRALLDTNDLARGISAAQRSISDYYVVSYYTTNTKRDGHYRKIQISVNHPSIAKMDYRKGYFAAKEFSKFTAADKERQLEDALMLEDPVTELGIGIELNYFEINRAEYYVPLLVKVPGSELALARHGGASHTLLDFIGEIKDIYGNVTVTNIRDHADVKLTDETEAQLARVPLEYNSGFTLLPGSYKLKFLVRDDETGRIGTYETSFTIPNLHREDKRVPISSVVLTSQRVPIDSAVYNATKKKDQEKNIQHDPLVSDGQRLVPSVTRVFRRSRNLYVYLQGYEPATVDAHPLVAYVGFYRDNALSFETTAISATPAVTTGFKVVPFNFSIPLSGIEAGDYDCQITVLDPSTGKSSFWRAPMKVLPE